MKASGDHLFTPVYLKLSDATGWPDQERAFYLLTRDGLFLCRNTEFTRSCVPVNDFPSELAGQEGFLKLRYPRIPRRLMEQVVGFFDLVGRLYHSEAAVLLAWNHETRAMEAIVPAQVGTVARTWSGEEYPLHVEYQSPSLPPHLVLLGDIHSHVDGPAYASFKDKADEVHRPGLHIVIGRIGYEPPQMHCEVIVDGFRFQVHDPAVVLEGYYRRRIQEVPSHWMTQVSVELWSSNSQCKQDTPESGHGSSSEPPNGAPVPPTSQDQPQADTPAAEQPPALPPPAPGAPPTSRGAP